MNQFFLIIEDLYNEKINIEKYIFGAVPLGKGNDLFNAMGFDSQCEIGIKIEYFQKVLYTPIEIYIRTLKKYIFFNLIIFSYLI